MEPESFQDLPFPTGGLDVSCEYELQPPGTTPVGLNVRGYEPGLNRARGGARPGLSRFIDQTLPLNYVSGSHLIQHLNTVIDPSGEAVASNVPDDPNGVIDPRTGRRIRKGGTGRQPGPKLPSPPRPPPPPPPPPGGTLVGGSWTLRIVAPDNTVTVRSGGFIPGTFLKDSLPFTVLMPSLDNGQYVGYEDVTFPTWTGPPPPPPPANQTITNVVIGAPFGILFTTTLMCFYDTANPANTIPNCQGYRGI
jgi:hypothetical protein